MIIKDQTISNNICVENLLRIEDKMFNISKELNSLEGYIINFKSQMEMINNLVK